jgi:hypothetical protein
MKVSDFERSRVNPFLEKAISEVQITRRYKTASSTAKGAVLQAFDPQSGEILGHTMFIRQIEVDEAQFAKVYLHQFESFWELNKSSIRVFGYLINKVKPKADKVEFFLDECLEYTKYRTKKPIYDGLSDLLAAQIIARGYNENIYFINPLIFFNGDRLSFVKTYLKKRANNNELANTINDVLPVPDL